MRKYWCCLCETIWDIPPTCHKATSKYIEFDYDPSSSVPIWDQMLADPKARTRDHGRWATFDPMLSFASDFKGVQCEWTEVISLMQLHLGDLIYIDGATWEGFLSEVQETDGNWVTVNIRFTPPKKTGFINKQYRVRRANVIRRINIIGS